MAAQDRDRTATETRERSEDVPYLRDDIIAVVMSDVHLSHKPPLARSCEKDWYEVQARYLEQVEKIRAKHDAVCLIAGDLFHSWREPSECVNFAIKHLPKNCFAIPGQHDLPYHRYEDIKRTPYWTLVQAGVVENIPVSEYRRLNAYCTIHGFPWGFPIESPAANTPGEVQIALVHKYIWRDATNAYHGASVESRVDSFATRGDFKGYHALIFGDNHAGFTAGGGAKGPTIFNCGTLIRRRSDEYAYKPRVGLLRVDGNIETMFLDTDADNFVPAVKDSSHPLEGAMHHVSMQRFIEGLERLENSGINFVDTIKREMINQKLDIAQQAIILKALGGRYDA